MIDFTANTIFVFPHLDDEFTLVPLLKKFNLKKNKNLLLIFCAERFESSMQLRLQRRKETFQSLKLLGNSKNQVIFLNDYFDVKDKYLYLSAENIFSFIKDKSKENKTKQICTLSFEGGHPDHDALALITKKIGEHINLRTFFFPAYNSRKTFFLPVSVFRPLKTQLHLFNKYKFRYFCWFPCLLLAFIYKSERRAFLKLLPFIIFQIIFSKEILYSTNISILTVNWEESLSLKRYKISLDDIVNNINKIKI